MTESESRMQLKTGDRIWLVPDRGNPQYTQITAVGRKWVSIDILRWRFPLASRLVESPGFGRVGQWFESREEWEVLTAKMKARNELIKKLGLHLESPLRKLSLDKLQAIDQILEGCEPKQDSN